MAAWEILVLVACVVGVCSACSTLPDPGQYCQLSHPTSANVTTADAHIAGALTELYANIILPTGNSTSEAEARDDCQRHVLALLCLQNYPPCQVGLKICTVLREKVFDICQTPYVMYDEDILQTVFPLNGFSYYCGCYPNGTDCVPISMPTLAQTGSHSPTPTPTPTPTPVACVNGEKASDDSLTSCLCDPGWLGQDCSCRECTNDDIDWTASQTQCLNLSMVWTANWKPGIVPLNASSILWNTAGGFNSSSDPNVCCNRFLVESTFSPQACDCAINIVPLSSLSFPCDDKSQQQWHTSSALQPIMCHETSLLGLDLTVLEHATRQPCSFPISSTPLRTFDFVELLADGAAFLGTEPRSCLWNERPESGDYSKMKYQPCFVQANCSAGIGSITNQSFIQLSSGLQDCNTFVQFNISASSKSAFALIMLVVHAEPHYDGIQIMLNRRLVTDALIWETGFDGDARAVYVSLSMGLSQLQVGLVRDASDMTPTAPIAVVQGLVLSEANVVTRSSTATSTSTSTSTSTITPTPTSSATATASATVTATSTRTASATATSTVTSTSTPTLTSTLTPTSSSTATATPTSTPTSTPSALATVDINGDTGWTTGMKAIIAFSAVGIAALFVLMFYFWYRRNKHPTYVPVPQDMELEFFDPDDDDDDLEDVDLFGPDTLPVQR